MVSQSGIALAGSDVATPPPSAIEIIETACRCCGNAEKERLLSGLRDVEDGLMGDYDISRCSSCRLVYLSRTPAPSSLGSCYLDTYHIRSNREMSAFAKFLYRLRKSVRLRQLVAASGSRPASLLEVGCGDGSFLTYIEEKWLHAAALVGTDIATGSVKLPKRSKVTLIETTAEDLRLGQCFDVIVMHQVLEHLARPVDGLKRIADHLQQGGILVGEVPNWDSPWRRLFPRHWGGLQIPRHQSFFDSHSLEATLRRAGLRLERINYTADAGDLGVSLSNWIADRFGLKTRPRQAWFFIPLMVASAPIVFVQTILFPKIGGLGFKARKAP
jgi:SAM-dependent methyltransferase